MPEASCQSALIACPALCASVFASEYMTKATLTDDIKNTAIELGFHAVGITTTAPFEEAERILIGRYKSGFLQGSSFNPDSIRIYTHPRLSFAKASSIIAVAISYLTDEALPYADEPAGPSRGILARFSRGLDYHTALAQSLSALECAVRRIAGKNLEARCWVDTGPLLDRSAAIRAGVGSPGKNTCVYVGKYGSWVVLGELVTDLDLEPDEPASLSICGECEECIKVCPTGAIREPYAVDMRICLSQVTQMKGFIPRWLRSKLGARVYGCDTCQSVCPLNRSAIPGNLDVFRPLPKLGAYLELLSLVNISPSEFKRTVALTTAGWIGRSRFRRNVVVAMGNIGDPAFVPALCEALRDPVPLIRAHAAWSLGRIGTRSARLPLEKALAEETDDRVIEEVRLALGEEHPEMPEMPRHGDS